jgi:hypothetical protein
MDKEQIAAELTKAVFSVFPRTSTELPAVTIAAVETYQQILVALGD